MKRTVLAYAFVGFSVMGAISSLTALALPHYVEPTPQLSCKEQP